MEASKEKIFQQLEERGLYPKEHGRYFAVVCPKCGKHEAFTYFDAGYYSWLVCNHRNNCGYKVQLKDILSVEFPLDQEVPEKYREYFEKHGLLIESLEFIIGSAISPAIILSKNGNVYKKDLHWEEKIEHGKKIGKYRWYNPKGFTCEMGEFYPVHHHIEQNVLYVFEGEWDWMKGITDGLACTTSLFGAGYIPKKQGWDVFLPYSEIKIVYDVDDTGIRDKTKIAKALLEKFPNKKIGFVNLPFQDGEGKDYCDYRLKHSLEEFMSLPTVPVEMKKTMDEKKRVECGKNMIKDAAEVLTKIRLFFSKSLQEDIILIELTPSTYVGSFLSNRKKG